MKKQGFTLLELLIVLTIMATLMVYSSISIKQAVRSKIKIEGQINDFSQIRDALKIIERDINLAFHYIDLEKELHDKIREQRKNQKNPSSAASASAATTATTTTIPQNNSALQGLDSNGCFGADDPICIKPENRVDPTTQFIGKTDELHFITMNASRIREDTPQADFVKIGYALRNCKKLGQEGKGSNCLMRRTSSVAEGDTTKGGEEVALLQDIQEFKFRYIGKGKQDWVTDWSTLQSDTSTKDKFPEAVEISVTVVHGEGEKKRTLSMQTIAAIRFPNNPVTNQEKQEQKTK